MALIVVLTAITEPASAAHDTWFNFLTRIDNDIQHHVRISQTDLVRIETGLKESKGFMAQSAGAKLALAAYGKAADRQEVLRALEDAFRLHPGPVAGFDLFNGYMAFFGKLPDSNDPKVRMSRKESARLEKVAQVKTQVSQDERRYLQSQLRSGSLESAVWIVFVVGAHKSLDSTSKLLILGEIERRRFNLKGSEQEFWRFVSKAIRRRFDNRKI